MATAVAFVALAPGGRACIKNINLCSRFYLHVHLAIFVMDGGFAAQNFCRAALYVFTEKGEPHGATGGSR